MRASRGPEFNPHVHRPVEYEFVRPASPILGSSASMTAGIESHCRREGFRGSIVQLLGRGAKPSHKGPGPLGTRRVALPGIAGFRRTVWLRKTVVLNPPRSGTEEAKEALCGLLVRCFTPGELRSFVGSKLGVDVAAKLDFPSGLEDLASQLVELIAGEGSGPLTRRFFEVLDSEKPDHADDIRELAAFFVNALEAFVGEPSTWPHPPLASSAGGEGTFSVKDERYDFFISHASEDRTAFVRALVGALRKLEKRVWFDEDEVLPGDDFRLRMQEGLSASECGAVVFSPRFSKYWTEAEVSVLLTHESISGKRIVPILLEMSWATLARQGHFLSTRRALSASEGAEAVAHQLCRVLDPAGSAAYDRAEGFRVQLSALVDRKRSYLISSEPVPAELTEQILALKRQLRSGPDLTEGDVLGERYQLVKRLGAGGFATVWGAWDRQDEKPVAVKVLHGQFARDETRKERFFRGARIMAGLNVPGIVRVLESRKEDGSFYFFVMELVEGGDLQRALRAGLSRERLFALLEEVGEAVSRCHEAGLVHRDLKPANVLLDANGHAKVTDFDLVRAEDTTGGTRTGALGTVLYMAPECVRNANEAAPKADVYALTMMAIVGLLKGETPELHRAYNPVELVKDLPVPVALQSFLAEGIALKPEARPADAGQWLEGFRAVLASVTGPALRASSVSTTIVPAGLPLPVGWEEVEKPDRYGRWARFGISDRQVKMRWIRPGAFTMGSPEADEEADDDERPMRSVTLTQGFWLAEAPCTQAFWRAAMGSNPSRFEGPNRPVETVSWHDAQEFLSTLNRVRPDLRFGLPTEAEWEYACRAGTETERYGPLDEVAWYRFEGEATHPVGHKTPNAWGLYDTLGNVWEWCEDRYGSYPVGPAHDPEGPAEGTNRVLRGGSWDNSARNLRAAHRTHDDPSFRRASFGFRFCCRPAILSVDEEGVGRAKATGADPGLSLPQVELQPRPLGVPSCRCRMTREIGASIFLSVRFGRPGSAAISSGGTRI